MVALDRRTFSQKRGGSSRRENLLELDGNGSGWGGGINESGDGCSGSKMDIDNHLSSGILAKENTGEHLYECMMAIDIVRIHTFMRLSSGSDEERRTRSSQAGAGKAGAAKWECLRASTYQRTPTNDS
ncbi:hypothetical protein CONPUDRAFT_68709 [Coniophora puteana RWD-64-598 SS2]|uniref:Uncharacterized protein n=1 Tax=Coniophora puteana (strain RWD-64-598) TaxID=741705 RepID=A0A5M3N4X3_CONPW|nr:uncharacterized protein CONPUDRAFT_68709 [Coniophora puteana RWD-64-598 SS2]EIW86104.1 hypothetical protein CONPUDRAFT_68709 [Coniophora puteana RWD-64-598 SS2]